MGVIPRQPLGRIVFDFCSVLLEGHQVIEGIDAVELAGVQQTHEDVSDLSPSESLIGQGVFPMKNGHF